MEPFFQILEEEGTFGYFSKKSRWLIVHFSEHLPPATENFLIPQKIYTHYCITGESPLSNLSGTPLW